jgi:hypothetical protein
MEVNLMFRLARFAALVSFLGLVLPVAAHAYILKATFQGGIGNPHVDASYLDENGFFGKPGFLFSGTFDATFLFDTDLLGTPRGPVLSSVITINGHSWAFPDQVQSYAGHPDNNNFGIGVIKDDGTFFVLNFNSDQPLNLIQVLSSDMHYTGTGYGWLRYLVTPNVTDLGFTPTDFTLSLVRGVPESTTWLVLLSGLAFLGLHMHVRRAALRKRRNLLISA